MTAPIRVRHVTTPEPSGCRWCGHNEREHAQRWTPVVKWHRWVEPTPAQRKARMLARRR
jgi:hypothetical protein